MSGSKNHLLWVAGVALVGAAFSIHRPDVDQINHEHKEHTEVVLHVVTEQVRAHFGDLLAAERELNSLVAKNSQDPTDDLKILSAIGRVKNSLDLVLKYGSVFDETARESKNVLVSLKSDLVEAKQAATRAMLRIENPDIRAAAKRQVSDMNMDTLLTQTEE